MQMMAEKDEHLIKLMDCECGEIAELCSAFASEETGRLLLKFVSSLIGELSDI